MKSSVQYYRVDRRQISFIKFILEAYDNMAVMSTLDPRQAVVQVTVAPGCEKAINDVLTGVAQEIEMVTLDRLPEPVVAKGSCIANQEGSTVSNEREKAPY